MSTLSKTIIVGRLGADPEVKQVGDNTVANFSVATNESWGDNEHTEWHRVVVWGKAAEACGQYLSKGSLVAVEGTLRTRSWETDDGDTRYVTELKAGPGGVTFLGGKSDEAGSSATSKRKPRRKRKSAEDFPVA